MGFEHGLFQASSKFDNKCGLVASFRDGKGAAVVLGSNQADMVAKTCQKHGSRWKSVGEHVGHNSASVDEYCTNFIPESSAMSAIQKRDPAAIIAAAKQGQFGAVMPGLKDHLFIVTAKPEFGECLFTAQTGKFGAAVCTCDSKECNNLTALDFIVDADKGPMRLLQFIDRSLRNLTPAMNSIVSGLWMLTERSMQQWWTMSRRST
eukprot:TRINITY_DN11807_c0_g1_i1.p3 TRINITY_DN11807_c0_g1~~TRINITY_DN11807_c0_g1_i1.p3  ORF type:complete len:206 (-),score=46.16 TRINITY_DN11807_c0_g1_i1:410-1027(-)